MRIPPRIIAGAAAIIAVAALVGCSNDLDSSPSSSSSPTTSAKFQQTLETAYKGVGGTIKSYPTVKVVPGKTVGIVSCGETISTCSLNAKAAKDAAEAAGWTATIYDGKLTQVDTAMRQAIAAKVDVLLVVGTNCSVYQSVFQEAHDAGVKIVSGGGIDDCTTPLFDADRVWLKGQDMNQQFVQMGRLEADYAAGMSNGNVKAIALGLTSAPFGTTITDALTSRLSELGAGSVVDTIPVSNPDSADGSYVQKTVSALLAHPEVNTLFATNDSWITNGLGQGIIQAGLQKKLDVISINYSGDASSFDLLRGPEQGMNATVAYAGQWGEWGSIDSAIRLFAGEKPIAIGEPIQVVDRSHNLPASGQNYDGSVDYKALFKKAWGK